MLLLCIKRSEKVEREKFGKVKFNLKLIAKRVGIFMSVQANQYEWK
jgi:hypothetical protein